MTSIYPDEGLGNALFKTVGPNVYMGLFVNNFTPDQSTVMANLTEAAWGGYAGVTLAQASWTISVAGHVGLGVQLSPVSFDNTSGSDQSAYGYFLRDNLGNVFQATRFDSAPLTRHDGESFVIIPVVGDFSTSL